DSTAKYATPDNCGKVLVRIPYFFLHIYNTTIETVRTHLGSAFLHNWTEGHEWSCFERIITEYEAIRTNLLIGNGCTEATLRSIYKGAIGRSETLNITVNLKELPVVKAAQQFPKTSLSIVGQEQHKIGRLVAL
ncbi:hypothetical protein EC968_008556, partial [Mortierella alpina]